MTVAKTQPFAMVWTRTSMPGTYAWNCVAQRVTEANRSTSRSTNSCTIERAPLVDLYTTRPCSSQNASTASGSVVTMVGGVANCSAISASWYGFDALLAIAFSGFTTRAGVTSH